jgi:cell division protease FtsH
MFLLWGFLSRRMGRGAGAFLNIGGRVHIHTESDIKVTFEDVAGAEEAKEPIRASPSSTLSTSHARPRTSCFFSAT